MLSRVDRIILNFVILMALAGLASMGYGIYLTRVINAGDIVTIVSLLVNIITLNLLRKS